MLDIILTLLTFYFSIGVVFTAFCTFVNKRQIVEETKRMRAEGIRNLAIYTGFVMSMVLCVALWPYWLSQWYKD